MFKICLRRAAIQGNFVIVAPQTAQRQNCATGVGQGRGRDRPNPCERRVYAHDYARGMGNLQENRSEFALSFYSQTLDLIIQILIQFENVTLIDKVL